MRVFVFNPDTEYAMATNSPYYIPPKSILKIADDNLFAMASLASEGDYLLVSDRVDKSELTGIQIYKDLKIYSDSELATYLSVSSPKSIEVIAWGWNRSLKHRLKSIGIPTDSLPSDNYLDKLRELSHRRISLEIDHMLTPWIQSRVINNLDEAMEWLAEHPESYFKSPWSSSGRGILRTSDLELKHIEPWLRGAIKHQGCVIAEKEDNRILDCASEWMMDNKEPTFLGYSVFDVSPRGKYISNSCESQMSLKNKIEALVGEECLANMIKAQKEVLSQYIYPYYSGPIGIDMYVTSDRKLRGCVEMNLRFTMGIIALFKEKKLNSLNGSKLS